MSKYIPWFLKIIMKIVFSRLPVGYDLWRRLNLFAHGEMHKPKYAFDVFQSHFDRSDFGRKNQSFVGLEIGPGDSLLSAMVATAHGASAYYLIDAGPYATRDLAVYHSMQKYLKTKKLNVPSLKKASDLSHILKIYNADYGTKGLSSLKDIPTASVDFIWSQAVLEHVRRGEFLDSMKELRRILRPDGVCSHRVDLKDHLGGALNNMRLPSELWEKNWMASSGFYTNRIRYSEMIDLFKQAGFVVEVVSANRWDKIPTSKKLMAKEFQALCDDDLVIKEFDVILRPFL